MRVNSKPSTVILDVTLAMLDESLVILQVNQVAKPVCFFEELGITVSDGLYRQHRITTIISSARAQLVRMRLNSRDVRSPLINAPRLNLVERTSQTATHIQCASCTHLFQNAGFHAWSPS